MNILAPEDSVEPTAIVPAQPVAEGITRRPSLPPLSAEDMARAAVLAKGLVRDEDALDEIVTFGNDARAAVAQVTKEMLAGVRLRTLEEVTQLSDGILTELHTLDVGRLAPAARRLVFGLRETAAAIQRRIKEFFRSYELVNTRLDRQEAEIFAKEAASTDRYHKDVALARSTLEIVLDARVKAAAIELFLDGEHGTAEPQRRLQAVAAEKAAAQEQGRSLDFPIIAAADRYAKYIERLQAKQAALHQVILSAYQMGVTIRAMADNENVIRQKLSDIRMELLPNWRTLIAIAYQAYQQQGIAQFVEDLSSADAQLRRKVADQLEQTSGAMAETMTRPVIDVDSMRYYHEKLVSSLDQLRTASFEAGKIRDAAKGEMQELIRKLGDAAASTSMRTE